MLSQLSQVLCYLLFMFFPIILKLKIDVGQESPEPNSRRPAKPKPNQRLETQQVSASVAIFF